MFTHEDWRYAIWPDDLTGRWYAVYDKNKEYIIDLSYDELIKRWFVEEK